MSTLLVTIVFENNCEVVSVAKWAVRPSILQHAAHLAKRKYGIDGYKDDFMTAEDGSDKKPIAYWAS